jgi:hypothetical protein
MLRRCEHSVYIPQDLPGAASPYCSYCRPVVKNVALRDWETEYDADDARPCCPICASFEFRYESEDKYHCPNCGFSEVDLW